MLKTFFKNLFSSKNTPEKKEGTVKFFNVAKGFGFIKVNDSNEEIFVHKTNLIDKIRQNDRVQFEVKQGKKGPSAVKVSVIK